MKKRRLLLFATIFLFFLGCQNGDDTMNDFSLEENEQLTIDEIETGSTSPECLPPTEYGCVRSPGYWKNHPEAWPMNTIIIGGVTLTKDEIIDIMSNPEGGDKTYTLFKAWVAAKLNVKNGSDWECIYPELSLGYTWLQNRFPGCNEINANSDDWQNCGEKIYLKLDKYNNGELCVPACD